jgi:hypothetical protein
MFKFVLFWSAVVLISSCKEQKEEQSKKEKPVIYLYPEKTTKVRVQVIPKGKFTFTYPAYNDGWNVTASPDGTLTTNGKTYNYLFWEGIQPLEMQDFKEGFLVNKANVIPFLEEKCIKFGFSSKEQADFITFWGPRLMENDQNLVQFVFNADCNKFAELYVFPKPDNTLRFYILYRKANSKENMPKAQEIPISNRNGFDVLEWGGIEMK